MNEDLERRAKFRSQKLTEEQEDTARRYTRRLQYFEDRRRYDKEQDERKRRIMRRY